MRLRGHDVAVPVAAFGSLLFLAFGTAGCGSGSDAQYREGMALLEKRETAPRGIELLTRFVAERPDDSRAPAALLALAAGCQSLGRSEEAMGHYERIMERHPDSPEVYKALFLSGYLAYDTLEDIVRARELLKQFITAYPDSDLAVSARVLFENLGRPIEDWRIVREINADGS